MLENDGQGREMGMNERRMGRPGSPTWYFLVLVLVNLDLSRHQIW